MARIPLDSHDEALFETVRATIRAAFGNAKMPSALAKRIFSEAARQRNKGRKTAIRRHPFNGVCEASGAPLEKTHAVLDELEPEKGYAGKVRWVCPKANNSGKHSCGVC